MGNTGKLYYIKCGGFYLKDETIIPRQQGRRKKWTFKELIKIEEDWEKSQIKEKAKGGFSVSFHEFFEVVNLDEKYERKQDELELKELIRRENEVETEQLSIFEVYGEL